MKRPTEGKYLRIYPFYYFIYWAMSAVINPYLGIYYQTKNFDGMMIGLANSTYSIAGIVFSLLIGFFVDRYNKVKAPLLTISICGILGALIIRYSSSHLMIISGVIGFACCMAPPSLIIDEQLIHRLGENSSRYAVFRRWGPVGYSLGSIVSSTLISRLGIGIIFDLFFFLNMLTIIIYLLLPNTSDRKKVLADQLPFGKSLIILLKNPMFYFCMVMLLLWGICEAGLFQFFNLFIISKGYDVSLTGWLTTASMLGEFVAYGLTVRLLVRKTDPRKLILVSFVLVMIHYLGVIYVRPFLLLMVIRVLWGAGFALLWSAVTELLLWMTPSKCSTTVQACKFIMVSGVGFVLGQMICGFFYNTKGLTAGYKILLVFPLLAIIIVSVLVLAKPVLVFDSTVYSKKSQL